MANRTEMVFKAAKDMYLRVCPAGLTEEEAWRDADEFCKQEYVGLAWGAWRSLMQGVPELGTISVGACLCLDEGLAPVRSAESKNCHTCGGRC